MVGGSSCTSHTPVVRTAPTAAPAPVSAFDRQIRNAQDAGDGDYQLRTLRARVAAEPDNVSARLELAKAYQERNYPDVALEICRLAAARFPESGAVQLALVRELRELNQPADAVAGLQAFLKRVPQNGAEYYSWLGILWDDLGELPTGELAHRQAIALAPSADYLHNNLGYNLLRQRKNAEAAAEPARPCGSTRPHNSPATTWGWRWPGKTRRPKRWPIGSPMPTRRRPSGQPGGGADGKRELRRRPQGISHSAEL